FVECIARSSAFHVASQSRLLFRQTFYVKLNISLPGTIALIRAILVDAEKHCLETLSWQLSKFCPEVEVVATSDNAENALGILRETEIDLVFLDIEMPVMNGFELLQHFKQVPFEIIFTTAYDIFAVKAFKFSALDYLLKPIDKD